MRKTVQEIASLIQGKVIGDPQLPVSGITNIETPGEGLITFIQDPKHLEGMEKTALACLIVPPSINVSKKTIIQVPNPKLAWAKLLGEFFPARSFSKTISKESSIAKTAKLGKNVTVECFAVIGENTVIGDETVILSHAVIGPNVKIGTKTVIHPSVIVYENCEIGNNAVLHAGCVVGADGFGYVTTAEKQEKVPQVGNVVIEDDVELGACTTIDRATIGSTRICKGVKIDNQVQVGHNVIVGAHTVISAQSGISGSSKIGAHVTMGGKAGLGDHVEIGDWTMVGAGSGLPSGKKIPAKQIIFGQPARPYHEARRQIGAQLRAAEMLDDIRALKKKVETLEKKLEDQSTGTK